MLKKVVVIIIMVTVLLDISYRFDQRAEVVNEAQERCIDYIRHGYDASPYWDFHCSYVLYNEYF